MVYSFDEFVYASSRRAFIPHRPILDLIMPLVMLKHYLAV